MKNLFIIFLISAFFLSGCSRMMGCTDMNAPCANEWTGMYYPLGHPGYGDVQCEMQEGFDSAEECKKWGESKVAENEKSEFNCGLACTYNKSCEYVCREMLLPVADGGPIVKDSPTRMEINAFIEEYLLSQKDFVWSTESDGENVCVFQYLTRNREVSPYELWVRCSEFVLRDGEIEEASGMSGPAKLTSPDNISTLALEHFSHEIPDNGSEYSPSIEKIFSAEAREFMREHHDRIVLDLSFAMAEKIMAIFAEQDPSFPHSMKQNCHEDADCFLPMSYAIRSNCPYGVECRNEKCEVVCEWGEDKCPTCKK